MANDSSALVQALISGGLTPAASRVIASAIANAATPQFSQARDISDATPRDQLRLIDADTRRYLLTNLDFSAEEPYQDRLESHPGRFAGAPADHPYKDAQPVAPVPPLSQPSVRGDQYISVENAVQDNTPVASVGLKLGSKAGKHLRINPATKAVDAVPMVFNSPQGLVTAEITENTNSNDIELVVRQLADQTVVLADGTSAGIKAWPNTGVTPTTVFTQWAQQNLMAAGSASQVLANLGTAAVPTFLTGSWTPAYLNLQGSTVQPSVTYDTANTWGIYTRIGNLVSASFRVRISAIASKGNGSLLAINNLPFTAKGIPSVQQGFASGAVSFYTAWNTVAPTMIYAQNNTTYMICSYAAPHVNSSTIFNVTPDNLNTGCDIIGSINYFTF